MLGSAAWRVKEFVREQRDVHRGDNDGHEADG